MGTWDESRSWEEKSRLRSPHFVIVISACWSQWPSGYCVGLLSQGLWVRVLPEVSFGSFLEVQRGRETIKPGEETKRFKHEGLLWMHFFGMLIPVKSRGEIIIVSILECINSKMGKMF